MDGSNSVCAFPCVDVNTWWLRCTFSAAAADEHHGPVQEYIANKLQKQADRLGTEKAALLKEKSDLQRQAWPSIALCTCIAFGLQGQIP